jgi:hypothetical protein
VVVVVVVVVGCKIGGMEREVRVGTRIWVEARTLTRPYIKTLIFGGVSLNKFELSRGVCYIIFQIQGYPTNSGPTGGYPAQLPFLKTYLNVFFGSDRFFPKRFPKGFRGHPADKPFK